MIEKLNQNHGITIVEREKLILAFEELGVGSTRMADESTRLKIGLMIGARFMIFGGYQVVNDLMRIDIRVVEVETGRLIKADQRIVSAADMAGWLGAAKEIAAGLIHQEHP